MPLGEEGLGVLNRGGIECAHVAGKCGGAPRLLQPAACGAARIRMF